MRTVMLKRMIIALSIALLGTAPLGLAQSNPTQASLKTAHETFVNALNSGNLTVAQAMVHPNALGFFRKGQKSVELSAGYGAAQALPSVVEDLGQFNQIAYDVNYRVIGDTGIVCMASILDAKKGSKAKDRYTRSTLVYVDMNGNWRLLSWHTSDIPLNK